MSTQTDFELRTVLRSGEPGPPDDSSKNEAPIPAHTGSTEQSPALEDVPANNAVSSTPEGGYGWAIVTTCATFTFWFNGISGSWGVIQAALLQSQLTTTPTSTISFVGTLGLACVVAFGLFGVRLVRHVGARVAGLLGVILLASAEISSSFMTSNLGGLFGCSGVMYGLGACLLYSISNTLPTQYFSARLGLASGIVKLGGGVGAAVLAVTVNAMISNVGIPWTFRILGLSSLATGLPAAWFIRERAPIGRLPFVDLALFRNLPFTAIFCAGAIGTFALFVPPFFLPLVAQSIGLNSSTGAGLVGAFNACTAVGRFLAGWSNDFIGPVNMFLLAMTLNAVSMLAIWPCFKLRGTAGCLCHVQWLGQWGFLHDLSGGCDQHCCEDSKQRVRPWGDCHGNGNEWLDRRLLGGSVSNAF